MAGMSTWMTDAGPFDVLAGLEDPDGHLVPYEELAVRATLLYGNGFTIRAAALEDIIRAKERANRAKDREALPELRARYGTPQPARIRLRHRNPPHFPGPNACELQPGFQRVSRFLRLGVGVGRVHPEGDRRVGVTEAVGHGLRVQPGGEKLGCRVVTKVMQPVVPTIRRGQIDPGGLRFGLA